MTKITRRTAVQVLAWVTISVALVAVAITSAVAQHRADRTAAPTFKICREEDGSDSLACWWHDERSGWVLNLDHGRTFYVADTGDVITSD